MQGGVNILYSLQMELVNIETKELASEADKGKAGSFRGSFQKQNITNGDCKGPKVLARS
jgi:hypothetical protein